MKPDAWCQLWIDFASGEKVGVELPDFPDPQVQKITNSLSGVATMKAAAPFYKVVDEEITRRVPNAVDCRLLDYGAGWGRITRLLLRTIPPENLWAADVDERLIEAARLKLVGVRAALIESRSRLPFDDASFDIIVSNSVFSHLSQSAHLFCIRQLARILRPGGLLLATTLGLKHLDDYLKNTETRKWVSGIIGNGARNRVVDGQFVYGSTGPWLDYGIAIIPQGWVTEHWASKFEIAATRTDYSQDVHVAIRR